MLGNNNNSGNQYNIFIDKQQLINFTHPFSGDTLLHACIPSNNVIGKRKNLVELILRRGATSSLNVLNKQGSSPLHLAVHLKNVDLIQLLVRNEEINIDMLEGSSGKNSLHLAAEANCSSICYVLINCGANKNILSNHGFRASQLTTDIDLCEFLSDKECPESNMACLAGKFSFLF